MTDPRKIAEEALRLAEGATDGDWTEVWKLIAHSREHYATLARALLAALDEREAMLADLRGIRSRAEDSAMLCGDGPERAWFDQIIARADAAIARLEGRLG